MFNRYQLALFDHRRRLVTLARLVIAARRPLLAAILLLTVALMIIVLRMIAMGSVGMRWRVRAVPDVAMLLLSIEELLLEREGEGRRGRRECD